MISEGDEDANYESIAERSNKIREIDVSNARTVTAVTTKKLQSSRSI